MPITPRRSSIAPFRLVLLSLAFAALFAAPASAYIVILKNGSQITTQKKYELQGDKVLLTLANGTKASYKASDVDFAKTDEVNRYGTLKDSQVLDVKEEKKLPVARPDDDKAFGDLISNRSLALPEAGRRPSAGDAAAGKTASGMTAAGFINLPALPRKPFADGELSSEIMGYLRGQGVDDVRIFQGSKARRALVEVVAASEASVFKVMKDAANCLLQMDQRFPKKLESIELYLTADGKMPAGQFTLTADLANQLASGRIEPATFFVRYVEF
jgi:hypothetical protein